MQYDCVLYDLDGTIIDSVPAILESFRRAFIEVLGEEAPQEYLLSTIGLPLGAAFAPYEPQKVREALHEAYLRHNGDLLPLTAKTFPGMEAALRKIQALGIPQGIVTSKRREPASFALEKLGFTSYFDLIVCREDTQQHKPNPEPLWLAAEKLGLSDYSRILYVGDSIHDLICASNAGIPAVAVDWTAMPKDQLREASPAFWINEPMEISCILQGTEL